MYNLAQINVAKFRHPINDPVNADFVANLDRVNAVADASPGFVWRLIGSGNSATDIQAFDDPLLLVNLSVWTDIESLRAYAYKNPAHAEIMRRRKEWTEEMQEAYVALWWIPSGHIPTILEAKQKLESVRQNGPTSEAFTFSRPFPPPTCNL
jgi:hypothetical protein